MTWQQKLKQRLAAVEAELAAVQRENNALKAQRISTRCPSCGHASLFVGSGGHLTCSWLECKAPSVGHAIDDLRAQLVAQTAGLKKAEEHAEFMLTAQDLDEHGHDDDGRCDECAGQGESHDGDREDWHGFCPKRELADHLRLIRSALMWSDRATACKP